MRKRRGDVFRHNPCESNLDALTEASSRGINFEAAEKIFSKTLLTGSQQSTNFTSFALSWETMRRANFGRETSR